MSVTPSKAKSVGVLPLVFIFVTIVINRIGQSIIFPILPFLVERFSSDALTLGLLSSSFSIAQFLAIPLIGALSDRYGRRPVLLICVLGSAISYFMFGWAGSLWIMFLSRIIDGATGGVAATAQAYIADVSSPQDRAKNFGLTGAAFGLGFTLGPAFGGALANINLNLPVFVAGAIALIDFILGYCVLPESLHPEQRRDFELRELNPINQLSDLLKNRRIRGLLISFFIYNFVFTGFSSVFVLFLNRRFGWGTGEAAVLFVVIGVVSTIVQGGLIRQLLPKFGEAKLSVVGLLLVAIAFGIIALIPDRGAITLPAMYLAQTMVAFGVGLIIPCLRGLISNRVSDRQQGKTLAGSQGLQSIAAILGPIWAGWIFDNIGILSPFWMGGLIMLSAVAFTTTNLPRKRKPPALT